MLAIKALIKVNLQSSNTIISRGATIRPPTTPEINLRELRSLGPKSHLSVPRTKYYPAVKVVAKLIVKIRVKTDIALQFCEQSHKNLYQEGKKS